MKPRNGQWIWFEPIYRFNVALLCCPPDQAKARAAKVLPADLCADLESDLTTLDCTARFLGCKRSKSGVVAVFWFKPDADVATIAHEVVHAAYWVLKQKGLQLEDASEEAYAYFSEWLVREIVKRRQR